MFAMLLVALLSLRVEIHNESACTLQVRAIQGERVIRTMTVRPGARASHTVHERVDGFRVDGPACGYDDFKLRAPLASNPNAVEITLREEPMQSAVRAR